MKKFSVNLTIPEILDGICDLEGYIEHLEDRIRDNKPSHITTRKQDKMNLGKARKQLKKFNTLLDLKTMEDKE